jgi:hypothetical protein
MKCSNYAWLLLYLPPVAITKYDIPTAVTVVAPSARRTPTRAQGGFKPETSKQKTSPEDIHNSLVVPMCRQGQKRASWLLETCLRFIVHMLYIFRRNSYFTSVIKAHCLFRFSFVDSIPSNSIFWMGAILLLHVRNYDLLSNAISTWLWQHTAIPVMFSVISPLYFGSPSVIPQWGYTPTPWRRGADNSGGGSWSRM